MKATLFALALSVLSTAALADVGSGELLNCSNDVASFEIHRTAVPTLFQGSIDLGGEQASFDCRPSQRRTGSLERLWECTESRDGEGRLTVTVEAGGFAGFTQAIVRRAQMHPLPAATVTTIICR